jgi:acyl carrier protein
MLKTLLIIASTAWLVGCGSKAQPQTVERVREEVAKILKKEATQIDVGKPLGAQGADELDIVEVVMAVEEAFKVQIPDSALEEKPGEVAKTLTVQKLADIVTKQTEKHEP